jgi:hypothetical protein
MGPNRLQNVIEKQKATGLFNVCYVARKHSASRHARVPNFSATAAVSNSWHHTLSACQVLAVPSEDWPAETIFLLTDAAESLTVWDLLPGTERPLLLIFGFDA